MRALARRGTPRSSLPYTAPFQPFLAYYGLFFNVLIILTQGFTAFIPWNTKNFFIAYISLILFLVLLVGYKAVFWRSKSKSGLVPLCEVDLDTGRREVDALIFDEPDPTNVWEKFWAKF